MALYKYGYTVATRTAHVALSPEALPDGAVDLGTFTDLVNDSKAIFHRIRDSLEKRLATAPATAARFPNNINDMAAVTISYAGNAIKAFSVKAAPVTMIVAATAAIVLKYQPTDATAVNSQFTFVSADTAIATVASTGVVTGVAAGSTYVTATRTNDGMTTQVMVTVTAA